MDEYTARRQADEDYSHEECTRAEAYAEGVAAERARCLAIARTMRIEQAIPDSEESAQDWCARYIEGEILGWPEEGPNMELKGATDEPKQ